jgi:hypothetical protein
MEGEHLDRLAEDIATNGLHEPTAFVLSANVHRRHLSTGQRAMAVAMLLENPQRLPTMRPWGMYLMPQPRRAPCAPLRMYRSRPVQGHYFQNHARHQPPRLGHHGKHR